MPFYNKLRGMVPGMLPPTPAIAPSAPALAAPAIPSTPRIAAMVPHIPQAMPAPTPMMPKSAPAVLPGKPQTNNAMMKQIAKSAPHAPGAPNIAANVQKDLAKKDDMNQKFADSVRQKRIENLKKLIGK